MAMGSFELMRHDLNKKYFFKYSFVPCGKFRSPYLGKTQQPQEQCCSFLSVCVVSSCVQTIVWLPVCLGCLTCLHKLMHGITHGGCADTVRESAPEVDPGGKIPCRTGYLNPCQYCACFFSRTPY